jgi:gamma-glutamyltranspeptidase
VLIVEEGVPEAVRNALAARGHTLRVTRAIGNAHALTIQYGRDGRIVGFTGAADPRGGGRAAGY